VRVAVFVSGTGTILEAMFDVGVPICLVVADRPCRGLTIAESHGVETLLVDRGPFGGFSTSFDRPRYSQALADAMAGSNLDLIAMAGFGTVLSEQFHIAYPGRILNTHPSLLPDFKGWHAVQDALDAQVTETGCTVHVATVALDEGPILAQQAVSIHEGDTAETLQERIKQVERTLYPATIMAVLDRLNRNVSITGEN
jgi:phosphoribosylglycinamide formyltransferase-1